jgi:serine phosphatase RsbU (regulator of sigma subunit)
LGVLAVTLPIGQASRDADADQHAALNRFAAVAAGLLWAKIPFGDTLVRLRRRSDLGLPAELQYSILPPLSFASDAVTVAAALEPCYHVAGDAIDYSVDDGRTRLAVFDGMGHGLHSAQCAVFTVAAYRTARRTGESLPESLHSIDEALTAGLGGEIFTTAVLAELDTRTGALQWVNAGHPEPLLLRGNRLVRVLETDPRPPLGLGHLLDSQTADIGREQLEPGDVVLLYTDGVTEARAPGGDFFGVERLVDLIIRHFAGGLTAQETMRRVVRELLAHHDGQLTDDATLLLVQWNGPAALPLS